MQLYQHNIPVVGVTCPIMPDPHKKSHIIPLRSDTDPQPDSVTQQRQFKRLVQNYTKSRMKHYGSNRVAIDALFTQLTTVQRAENFFGWAKGHFKDITQYNYNPTSRIPIEELKSQLARANWRRGGSALSLVNTRLRYNSADRSIDYIPMGIFGKFWLALQVDSSVMIPKETDSASLDLHEVTAVNSNNTLGARYESVVAYEGKQTLEFAQLGSYILVAI